jgi:hypothetical protein
VRLIDKMVTRRYGLDQINNVKEQVLAAAYDETWLKDTMPLHITDLAAQILVPVS